LAFVRAKPDERQLKPLYGIGQVAQGIEHAATSLFVLFLYQVVLGVPGWLVGLGLGLSLAVDAVTDPLMGLVSDNTRHRWGRRHPWMIAAALPLGLCTALLFAPPASLGPVALGAWAMGWLIAGRLALTAFFVPHLALGVELSTDHDERTRIQAWRVFFTYAGSAFVVIAARGVFLAPSETFPDGQLDPAGYPGLGLVCGAVMVLSILVSAAGTWSARHGPAPVSGPTVGQTLRAPLANQPFRVFVGSLLVFFVARGVGMALEVYMGTYFWVLGANAVALPGATLLGVLVGTPLWAVLAGRIEKRTAWLSGMLLYTVSWSLPPMLELSGAFPEGPARLPLLLTALFVGGVGGAAAVVAGASMLADVTDVHELETGRRDEGLFFGALSFARKAATGLGGLIAGLLLTGIGFPEATPPDQVDPAVIAALGAAAGPGTGLLAAVAVFVGWRYPLTRAVHAGVRAQLDARR
jgi:glycoside/pentoside/hexuronide:cation symporter, GPH family